jgi:hypothetical protein
MDALTEWYILLVYDLDESSAEEEESDAGTSV